MKKELNVWTDGSCKVHTTKRGGWAFVVLQMPEEAILHEDSNSVNNTTISVMEMTALLRCLEYLHSNYEDHKITILSDSEFVVRSYNEWLQNWILNGWRTASGEAVKHREIWEAISWLSNFLDFNLVWVKGHSDHKWNNYVDSISCIHAESTNPVELLSN